MIAQHKPLGDIKKIEVKRKYVYITHYGRKATIIVDKRHISEFMLHMSCPEPEPAFILGSSTL